MRFVFVDKSSNGDAIISVNIIARRFFTMSLDGKKFFYKGFGCQLIQCPFPNRCCIECRYNFK